MNNIHPSAKIASDVILGHDISIAEGVVIDHHAIIHDHVSIAAHSYIGCQCILGEYLADFYQDYENTAHPLTIGPHALLRSGTIIYGDTAIGSHFQTGHRTTIREKTVIGDHVRLGTMADIQGHCSIGRYVSIHSGVFVAPNSIIEDYVWLFPHVVLTNDPTPPSDSEKGVTIRRFASVAARAMILPGLTIGEHALIGAGSVVTHDVPPGKAAVGTPARVKGDVETIINPDSGEPAYPWPRHFSRGMPWKEQGYDAWAAQHEAP